MSSRTALADKNGYTTSVADDGENGLAVTEYIGRFEFVQMNYGFLKNVRVSRGKGPTIGDVFMHKSVLKADRCLCTERIEDLDGSLITFSVRASTKHLGKLEAYNIAIKRRSIASVLPLEK